MKNRIIGFTLLLVVCAVVYALALWGPLGKNLKTADFFKGFTLGFGSIVAIALLVLLVKRAREKDSVIQS